jgi:hypothetical protein
MWMSVATPIAEGGDLLRARARSAPRLQLSLAVGLACLALAGLADALLRHEKGITGDGPFYVRMAAHPGRAHSFPYAYRIAVPWLVHVMPFSQTASFQLVALLAIGASSAALYALMREFDASPLLAGALAVGFAISPEFLVVLIRHGRSVDPASILVMVLGCLFIVRRQKLALALTILVGAAVKETSLFLIPLAYTIWAQQVVDRRALRDVALVCVAPIAAYIALRTSISAIGNQYTPGYTGSFLNARIDVFRQVFTGTQLRRLAYAYGPLWLAAPFALRNLPFARRGLVLVALCIISLSVSFDAGRVMFLAVPVFYVAAAFVLENRRRLAIATVIALLALDVGYAVYMQTYGVEHGVDSALSSPIPIQ